MALVALTTADLLDFVSTADPSVVTKEVPFDPDKPDGPKKKEVVSWKEDASVFKVSGLDVYLMGYIYDTSSHLTGRQGVEEVNINQRINATNIDAVRFGLRALPDDWRTSKGELIQLKTEKTLIGGREYQAVTRPVLDSLGLRLIGEMASFIKEKSEVTPVERKNSEGSSSESGSSLSASAPVAITRQSGDAQPAA